MGYIYKLKHKINNRDALAVIYPSKPQRNLITTVTSYIQVEYDD